MHTSNISIDITLDNDKVPQQINWQAADSTANTTQAAKAMMLAFWDGADKSALRIDLWTKDMMVDEMKKFYHQNIMTLTETYVRATGDTKTADAVKDLFVKVGKEMGVIS